MKLYLVNDKYLYHLCKEDRLDSLFDIRNGKYKCRVCRQESDSFLFIGFQDYDNRGFITFTDVDYSPCIIELYDRKRYKVVELT